MNVFSPENVTNIGECAFSCSDLRSVTVLSHSVHINDDAFIDLGDDLNIYGYENSTAQTCASNNGFRFYPISTDEAEDAYIKEYWDWCLEYVMSDDTSLLTYVERAYIVVNNGKQIGRAHV